MKKITFKTCLVVFFLFKVFFSFANEVTLGSEYQDASSKEEQPVAANIDNFQYLILGSVIVGA